MCECQGEHNLPFSDMQAVCWELGYTEFAEFLIAKHLTGEDRDRFITGDEKIWLADPDCSYDTRMYACDHGPWGYHRDACTPAVVTCVPDDDVSTVTDDPGDGMCSNEC